MLLIPRGQDDVGDSGTCKKYHWEGEAPRSLRGFFYG